MKNKKLIRIISAALVVASLSALNIKQANADWKSDNNGWWYSEGDSWSVGWKNINDKWYYFNTDGYMVTGWKLIDNKWYFFAGDGSMSTGLLKAADGDYYLDESGALRTGWFKIGAEWHYYNEDGTIKNGWLSYNSKWYYIKDGTMLKNTVIDGYEIDNNGEWIQKGSRDEQLKNESEEVKKVKESILKEDSVYINKFKDFDFNLGLAEEKNTKDLFKDYSNIPEEKCYQIAVYMDKDEEAFASYFYVVGLESKKIYATENQGGCDIYEIKDNKINKTFYYKNDENTSVQWRGMPIHEIDEDFSY